MNFNAIGSLLNHIEQMRLQQDLGRRQSIPSAKIEEFHFIQNDKQTVAKLHTILKNYSNQPKSIHQLIASLGNKLLKRFEETTQLIKSDLHKVETVDKGLKKKGFKFVEKEGVIYCLPIYLLAKASSDKNLTMQDLTWAEKAINKKLNQVKHRTSSSNLTSATMREKLLEKELTIIKEKYETLDSKYDCLKKDFEPIQIEANNFEKKNKEITEKLKKAELILNETLTELYYSKELIIKKDDELLEKTVELEIIEQMIEQQKISEQTPASEIVTESINRNSLSQISDAFYCPLSNKLLINAVVIESGECFDDLAIRKYLKENGNTCPVTNAPLSSNLTVPNLAVRSYVNRFILNKSTSDPKEADELNCPIMLELFQDPILLMNGQSFEKESIEKHLKTSRTCPSTGISLDSKKIIPNTCLKKIVDSLNS